jgi:hypothetical protein
MSIHQGFNVYLAERAICTVFKPRCKAERGVISILNKLIIQGWVLDIGGCLRFDP